MIFTGLLLGAALGYAMQRGRFCVTGAFRDLWVNKSSRWFSAFMLVVAIQSVGVFALDSLGVITLADKPFPWLATIVGGFIFGYSIVYAGGCATGTYYRSGEGLIGSWIALTGYAVFSAITKTGALAPFNDAIHKPVVETTTIHGALGISPWVLVAALVIGVAAWVRHHQLKPALMMATLPPKHSGLRHLLAEKPWTAYGSAVVIGIIAIVAWPLSAATGRNDGLGITTPSANLVNFLVSGDTTFVDWGVYLVVGILIGSFIAAKASGEFRLRVPDAKTVLRSAFGGAGMGIGASLAGGCTIGNAMVKTATFSIQGWVALAFMVLGTGAAAYQTILKKQPASTRPLIDA